MTRFALPTAALCFGLLSGCGSKISATPDPQTGTDAGSTDAGSTDAGSTDAGSTDAGSTDAGSTDAGSTDAGSTDAGSTTSGASPIAQLQQYDGVSEGDTVTVQGVVSSPDTGSGFYMADASAPWSGIWVFHEGTASVSQGDRVEVTGQLIEFNELTELDASAGATVTMGTGTIPDALIVAPETLASSTDAEPYEGVLVTVVDVATTSLNPDHPDDYGEFVITAGLRVDDYFFDADPGAGETFASLSGILIYSFDAHKLAPRDASDVVR